MTGMRRGELAGLRWGDVDFDSATVTVRQTVTLAAGEIVFGEPKTARGRRTIDIDAETVTALREHRKCQLEHRMLLGAGWANHDLVFCSPVGQPWKPDSISQAFDRQVTASGLPRVKLHALRHGHATHLLAAGVNPRIVSERLGHASVGFTLDVYAHALPGQQADAAAAVAALVAGS
jgi:integrase